MRNIGFIGDSLLDPFFSGSPVTEQTEVAMLLMNALGEPYSSVQQFGSRAGNADWTWTCPTHTSGKAYVSNYKFVGSKYTVWNGACAGDETSSIAGRVANTFANSNIDVLVIQGGVNDVARFCLGGHSVEQSIANIRQTIESAKAIGISRFVLCSITPLEGVRSGYDFATWKPIQDQAIADLNALIEQECIANGYAFADWHSAVCSASDQTYWNTSYRLEGTHGNVAAQSAFLSTFNLADFQNYNLDVTLSEIVETHELDVKLLAISGLKFKSLNADVINIQSLGVDVQRVYSYGELVWER